MIETGSGHFAINRQSVAGDRRSLREDFCSRLPSGVSLIEVFEHLSGVHFFLKDDIGRMIAFNSLLLQRLGIPHESDVIGATDYDLFPRRQADRYLDDDRRVLTTGTPLINRNEAWRNEKPIVTSKFPVRDALGRVIGVMGMFQLSGRQQVLSTEQEIDGAVHYIHSHLGERMTIEQIAERAFISPRQLRRKFSRQFGMSVQEFVIKARIEAASDELRHSSASIAEIANRFGFCDQAAFTNHFRKRMGMTPRRFRCEAQ